MQDRYLDEDDGCAGTVTDAPSISIELVDQGRTKAVSLYEGCLGATVPTDAMRWLADSIDYLANTRPLVSDR